MSALATLSPGFKQQSNGPQMGSGFQQQGPQLGGGFQQRPQGPQMGGGFMQQGAPQMGGGFQAQSPLGMLGQYRQGMSPMTGETPMPAGVFAPHMGGAMTPGMIPNTQNQVLNDYQPGVGGMPQQGGGLMQPGPQMSGGLMAGDGSPLLKKMQQPMMSGGFRDGR